jgi:SNF2-related domain
MSEIYVPKVHDKLAIQFLLRTQRAQLIKDPGMGKTGDTLAALDILKLAGSQAFPALVLAPMRVARSVWTGEIQKWSTFNDIRAERVIGTAEARLSALKRSPMADLYSINYENIPWLMSKLGDRPWPFRTVIADESTRLKGFRMVGGGVRTHALSKIAKHTMRWINLTGTPAPNGYPDLWGQYWFIDFGARLGRSYTRYLEDFFTVNEYSHEVKLKDGSREEIQKRVADITISFRAEDWMDILKPQVTPVEIDLPPKARALYDQMEADFEVEFGGGDGIWAPNSAAKANKLLQIASGFIYDGERVAHHIHDEKLDAVEDVLESIGSENLLLVHWYKPERAAILKRFPFARVLDTQADEDDWNAGKIKLLAVQPGGAGHGLNLQHGGRNIAVFTPTWDLELADQVLARLGPVRQEQAGYRRTVRIFLMQARATVDVEAYERIETKASVQNAWKLRFARKP